MPKQQNNTRPGNEAGNAPLRVLLILAVAAGVLFALYELNDRFKFVDVSFLDAAKETALKSVPEKWLPEKWASEKQGKQEKQEKQEKPAVGKEHKSEGKSLKDVLGGPEFSGGKASIQQVALHGGAPEPVEKASPAAAPQAAKPEMDVAPPPPPSPPATSQPMPAPLPPPPPPPTPFPSFPKTNAPTLNLTVETPQSKKQPPPPTPAPQPAAVAQPAPPPPPPPPSKPRATMTLSNINGRLSDRADLNVSMAVELTYEVNNALREELEFKRDMLSTVAGSVLRRHEYGNVNTATLKTDILATFNGHLQAGKLVAVEIKDLQIGQVAVK